LPARFLARGISRKDQASNGWAVQHFRSGGILLVFDRGNNSRRKIYILTLLAFAWAGFLLWFDTRKGCPKRTLWTAMELHGMMQI